MLSAFVQKKIILVALLITASTLAPAKTIIALGNSDTLVKRDSAVLRDTVKQATPKKSFIDEKVIYSAQDSMIVDIENKKAYLYNNAVVTYDDMKLTAGYIEIDFDKNMVYSKGIKDSTGKIVQIGRASCRERV